MQKAIAAFESACASLGKDPLVINLFDGFPEVERKWLKAHYRITTVIEARCKEKNWEPNWNDPSQRKYYAWPDVEASDEQPSGFGLSYHDCDYSRTDTTVGSRLCLPTPEDVREVFEMCKADYTEYFLKLK